MGIQKIDTLFCDIGGVLMSNGWDRGIRAKAAEQFGFDLHEFEGRHQLCFYLYEIGQITLEEYLSETLFYVPRSFTMDQFIAFMYAQTQVYEDMIAFIHELKSKYGLKIVLLSNEGRELALNRLRHFKLDVLADFFIVSSFVYLRKPDRRIYQMALDLVQKAPENIIYLDDRQLFIEIASGMGISSIRHVDLPTTRSAIEKRLPRFGV